MILTIESISVLTLAKELLCVMGNAAIWQGAAGLCSSL